MKNMLRSKNCGIQRCQIRFRKKVRPKHIEYRGNIYPDVRECNVWKCMYCKILDIHFATCMLGEEFKITPNHSKCPNREDLPSRLFPEVKQEWDATKENR